MNIVVCVKYVPDATADRQFESDNTVDRVGVDGLLSELDEYAVEQALQIKEKAARRSDVEVTALCIGPEKAVDAVRKALQMGADKGVHVDRRGDRRLRLHRDLAGPRQGDREDRPRQIRADLVVCGMASTDGSGERRPGDARRAPRPPAGHLGLGGRDPGRPGPHQARRRHRDRGHRRHAAAGALGDRPDRRGPLPVVQGDHGGQEEAAGDLVAVATSASTPTRSACPSPWSQVEETTARPPRTAGEIVTDEDGSGATR